MTTDEKEAIERAYSYALTAMKKLQQARHLTYNEQIKTGEFVEQIEHTLKPLTKYYEKGK